MRRPPPPSLPELQRQCDDWNKRHGIGAAVIVRRDDGSTAKSLTRSQATVLSGHSAVICVDGISGCYALDRVWPAPLVDLVPA